MPAGTAAARARCEGAAAVGGISPGTTGCGGHGHGRRRDGPGRSAQPGLSPPAQPGWWHHRVRRRVRKPPRGRWWPTVASRRWRPSRRGRSSVRRAGHGRHAAISECRHNGSPHFVARNNDADPVSIRVRSLAGDAVSGPLSLFRHRSVRGRPRAGSVLFFCRDPGSPRAARQLTREGLEGLFRATLRRPRCGAHRSRRRWRAGLRCRFPARAPSSSPVDPGGRPAPPAVWRLAWRPCRDRAEVGPNFLSARLNPGEAAAVLCKRAVRKGAEFLMLLGETVRRRGTLCGQESEKWITRAPHR